MKKSINLQNYLLKLGTRLADKNTGQKTYWKIVNNLLDKCKIPRIPPLLVADKFVTICKEKATLFNNYFVAQCQPFQNISKLPEPNLLTRVKLDTFEITSEQIANILTGFKVNKAHGPDDPATEANLRQHPKNHKISKAMEDS